MHADKAKLFHGNRKTEMFVSPSLISSPVGLDNYRNTHLVPTNALYVQESHNPTALSVGHSKWFNERLEIFSIKKFISLKEKKKQT